MTLRHYRELTNVEIAEAMAVSVDAVESLLARGRRGLKDALAGMREELMENAE
jgi:RNA polymerase sigma-70 factor (ECF subfamily)